MSISEASTTVPKSATSTVSSTTLGVSSHRIRRKRLRNNNKNYSDIVKVKFTTTADNDLKNFNIDEDYPAVCGCAGLPVTFNYMLNRDLRTAKMPLSSSSTPPPRKTQQQNPNVVRHEIFNDPELTHLSQRVVPGRTSPPQSRMRRTNPETNSSNWSSSTVISDISNMGVESSCYRRRQHNIRTTAPRVTLFITTTVALSFIALVPGILAAPLNRLSSAMSSDGSQGHPKWINPCGFRTDNVTAYDGSNASDSHQISDSKMLNEIIVNQAKIAKSKAEQFKDEFANVTFKKSFDEMHNDWKNEHLTWLPTVEEVPKGLNQSLSTEYLESLELDPTLINIYTYLQKIAAGLEQVTIDQEKRRGPHASSFKEAEDNLRALLCEVQTNILERNLTQAPDVQRDIMPEEYRNMEDSTRTNIRDWLIYRDYMNLLEYVIEVFSYFSTKA